MVPGLPEYIDGVSYWIPDITDLRKQMAEMQGAEMTDRYRRGAERMEAEYVRNLERAKQEIENELNGIDKKLDEEKADAENKDKDKLDSSGKKTVEEKLTNAVRMTAKNRQQTFCQKSSAGICR